MNFLDRWRNIVENAKSMKTAELESLRYLLIIFLVADLFGVYWYLGAKKVGMAILIVLIFFLAIILILERRFPEDKDKYEKEYVKPHIKPEKQDKEESKEKNNHVLDLGLGFPDTDDYEDNLNKALGF